MRLAAAAGLPLALAALGAEDSLRTTYRHYIGTYCRAQGWDENAASDAEQLELVREGWLRCTRVPELWFPEGKEACEAQCNGDPECSAYDIFPNISDLPQRLGLSARVLGPCCLHRCKGACGPVHP